MPGEAAEKSAAGHRVDPDGGYPGLLVLRGLFSDLKRPVMRVDRLLE